MKLRKFSFESHQNTLIFLIKKWCQIWICAVKQCLIWFKLSCLSRHYGIKMRVYFKKTSKKSTCGVMPAIVISFSNQTLLQLIWLQVLEIWSKFQTMWICKKLNKQRELFSPNTDNFLAFFYAFEWGRILKMQWIHRKRNIMQNYVLIIFRWTFPY